MQQRLTTPVAQARGEEGAVYRSGFDSLLITRSAATQMSRSLKGIIFVLLALYLMSSDIGFTVFSLVCI